MSDLIQNKMNNLLGDLARPTKFKCIIYPPDQAKFQLSMNGGDANPTTLSSTNAAEYLDWFCYAASFPGVTVEQIDFKYRGRNLPVRSIQTYEQTWTATFYNDEKHAVRRLFIDWALLGQNHLYAGGATRNYDTMPSISIYQQDFELTKDMVVYTMMNVFPKSVGAIETSYDNLNQVESFTVEFAFTHFEINTVSGTGLTSQEVSSMIQSTIQNTINNIKDKALDFARDIGSSLLDKAKDLVSPYTEKISESFDNFLG